MNNKKNVCLICGIIVLILSLLFFVIRPVTGIFLISYIFALIGLAGLAWSVCYVIDHKKSYPWITAIPMVVRTYLIIELGLSAIIVLVEQIAKWGAGVVGSAEKLQFVPGWYLLIHCVLLLIFFIRIIVIKGGATHIEARDAAVGSRMTPMKSMTIDAELLSFHAADPALKKRLSALAEKLKYSDPMSTEVLEPIERQIGDKLDALKAATNVPAQADALIDELELLIEERNKTCKTMK